MLLAEYMTAFLGQTEAPEVSSCLTDRQTDTQTNSEATVVLRSHYALTMVLPQC